MVVIKKEKENRKMYETLKSNDLPGMFTRNELKDSLGRLTEIQQLGTRTFGKNSATYHFDQADMIIRDIAEHRARSVSLPSVFSRKEEEQEMGTPKETLHTLSIYGDSRNQIMGRALVKGREFFGHDNLKVTWEKIYEAQQTSKGKFYAHNVNITETGKAEEVKTNTDDTFTAAELEAGFNRIWGGSMGINTAKKVMTAIRENRILDAYKTGKLRDL